MSRSKFNLLMNLGLALSACRSHRSDDGVAAAPSSIQVASAPIGSPTEASAAVASIGNTRAAAIACPETIRTPNTTVAEEVANGTQIVQALLAARAGRQVELTVAAHNPWGTGEEPPFSLDEHLDSSQLQVRDSNSVLSGSLYTVFPKPLVDGNEYEFRLGEYGHGDYLLRGFFTGRLIDALSWTAHQDGRRVRADDYEDRGMASLIFPEFCVTNWCVLRDAHPNRFGLSGTELSRNVAKYEETMSHLASGGVRECARPAPRHPP